MCKEAISTLALIFFKQPLLLSTMTTPSNLAHKIHLLPVLLRVHIRNTYNALLL